MMRRYSSSAWGIYHAHKAVSRSILTRGLSTKGNKQVNTLEELTKLQSLNDVDPEVIRRLISERTSELNAKNELEMLRNFSKEDELATQSPLKKFTRPAWIFLLMASTVYLLGHLVWWNLEYKEREIELYKQVNDLEDELQSLLAKQRIKSHDAPPENQIGNKAWYKRWFWY